MKGTVEFFKNPMMIQPFSFPDNVCTVFVHEIIMQGNGKMEPLKGLVQPNVTVEHTAQIEQCKSKSCT